MNIKRIIREELDGLEWIKDIKSNQDISQEIADKTKIKNGKLYPPFLPPSFNPLLTSTTAPLSFSSPTPLFRNYGKEQYGLNDVDVNDVWERYKKLIKNKVNNINESIELEAEEISVPQSQINETRRRLDLIEKGEITTRSWKEAKKDIFK